MYDVALSADIDDTVLVVRLLSSEI